MGCRRLAKVRMDLSIGRLILYMYFGRLQLDTLERHNTLAKWVDRPKETTVPGTLALEARQYR